MNIPNKQNWEWLCNIVNSLIQEDFKSFIQKNTKERRKVLIDSQNLEIMVWPNFMRI